MLTRMNRRASAFTLIELLIVVAIIAILAAIAVPNFLEAQTRSKVSRVKSDMRTMATALEAYRVDYNRYVPTHHDGSQGDVPAAQAMALTGYSDPHVYDYIDFCGQRLTTPVAYLTSIAHPSPFQIQAAWYRERGFFFVKRAANPSSQNTYYDWWGFRPQNGHQNVPWFLMDGGPDQIWWQNGSVGVYEVTTQYDPTNGTVSSGNMWWLGGGGN